MAEVSDVSVFIEDWDTSYGSPYLIAPDAAGDAPAELCEDGAELRFHEGDPSLETLGSSSIAFVDGVRRGEAALYQVDSRLGLVRGVAGAHACGAVIALPGQRLFFDAERIQRLVIWGSGLVGDLPATASGFRWESRSIAGTGPDEPLRALQNRMRRAEAELARAMCERGHLTVLDGPLPDTRGLDLPILGYIKTHHKALLPPAEHARVASLGPGQRTSLFRLAHERYSAYLRLVPRGALSGPWAGIIRLEIPASAGLAAAVKEANRAAYFLPRYAGVPHTDPRAPQNLQPVGALESHLRHLLGDGGLAARAVREAVQRRSATVKLTQTRTSGELAV